MADFSKPCAKVIAVYFGPRRNNNNNPQSAIASLALLQESVRLEETLDPGIAMDVFLVHNDTGYTPGAQFLNHLDGKPTARGTFRVIHRGNRGASFGAFCETFLAYRYKYDSWLFCEDDILITTAGIPERCARMWRSDPHLGFIALSPIDDGRISKHRPHCGGGFGFTMSAVLSTVVDRYGCLPCSQVRGDEDGAYQQFQLSEERFTGFISECGYKIVNLLNASPLCSNYLLHEAQGQYIGATDMTLPFIYRVGGA